MSYAPNMQPTTQDRSEHTAGTEALALAPCSASYFDSERLALLEAGARVLGNEECRKLADEIRSNQNMPPMNMPNVRNEPRP